MTTLEAWVTKRLAVAAKSNKVDKSVKSSSKFVASVFSLPLSLLFECAECSTSDITTTSALKPASSKPAISTPVSFTDSSGSSAGLTCLACSICFADRAQQQAHFKSDSHRVNLSRKIQGIFTFAPLCKRFDFQLNSIAS